MSSLLCVVVSTVGLLSVGTMRSAPQADVRVLVQATQGQIVEALQGGIDHINLFGLTDMRCDIEIFGHSCSDWSSGKYGAAAFRALTRAGIAWKRWGTAEPYREKFCEGASGVFTKQWKHKLSSAFGMISVHAGEEEFFAMFVGTHGPKPAPSFFSLRCPPSLWSHGGDSLIELSHRLFHSLDCFHGQVCHSDEYHAQHYSERREGGGTRVVMLGIGYRECLPGIYWSNLFGPPVSQWIGEERLRTCPCHERRELAPGYHLLTAYPEIDGPDTPEALAAKDAIREHLGVDRFFDRRFPDRVTNAPPLDWSELYRATPKAHPQKLVELQEKARKMGGWLEVSGDEMSLHLDGPTEPKDHA